MRDATLDVLRGLGMTTVFSNPSHTEMKLFEYWPEDDSGSSWASRRPPSSAWPTATPRPPASPRWSSSTATGLGNAMGSVYTAAAAKTPMVILGGQQARKMLLGDPFLVAKDATQLPKPYISGRASPAGRRTCRR
ncbi:Benzoylformate decarboxylase OS=Streptomyces glaucescens OX=1907 GN=SGLAU_07045 PE=3 SV=1 [Streptomyces glaucescens]